MLDTNNGCSHRLPRNVLTTEAFNQASLRIVKHAVVNRTTREPKNTSHKHHGPHPLQRATV